MSEDLVPLHLRGKKLEELFFFQQDRALAGEKRRLEKRETDLKILSEISGIADEAILRKLVMLGIQVDVLATLSVIPLVATAWADGKLDEKEREAVLKAAAGFGLAEGKVNFGLFARGLERPPSKGLLESWIFYMQGLCQLLEKDERRALKTGVLRRARAIAEAQGAGTKPRGRISRRKEEILLRLEQAFEPLSFKI